jgi:hypothetical protein
MNWPAVLVLIGAAINVVGTSSYVRDTLQGRNKPNRMSFLMWSIAPIIGVAASFAQGVTWAVIPVFFTAFCPFIVFLASFINPNSYWKLGVFDYLCGLFSVLALVLWYFTHIANIAIVFAMLSDGLAGLPTVIKAWRFPHTESATGYVASSMSVLTSFAATPVWSFAAVAFPAYIFCLNTLIISGILRGRKRVRMI